MSDTDAPELPRSKAEMLERVNEAWQGLAETLAGLSEAQLLAVSYTHLTLPTIYSV